MKNWFGTIGPYSALADPRFLAPTDKRTMSPREFGRRLVGKKRKKKRGK